MPHARFINATHTQNLVLSLANKSLRVMESAKYKAMFPEIVLTASAKGSFANTAGGDRIAATVGGKNPMGEHGHFLTMDDPIDPQKVLSEVELNTAKEFVENDLATRTTDKLVTVMILVMQRLGRGDPTEVMRDIAKRDGGRKTRVVCLPCDDSWEIEPPEVKHYYRDWNVDAKCDPNGLMDPVRLPESVLKAFRARSEWKYAGQFGQSPRPKGGGLFQEHWFNQRVPAAPYNAKRIRYWDRACLIAGTEIETINGPVSIEDVKAGDFVLTRRGYKKVKWSGFTKFASELVELRLPNGGTLIGTPDHRIWTTNAGWVELAVVSDSRYCISIPHGDDTWQEKAKAASAQKHFWGPSKQITATGAVRRWEEPFAVPVYDLEVEDAHEFFANGVLVHNSTDSGGCYTAGVLMAFVDGEFFVEHVVHGQWEPDERNKRMRATALRDRSKYGKHEPIIYVEREGGSSGRDAWKGVVRALVGFVVKEDTPTGSKDTRAEPWSTQLSAGNVKIVEDDSWDIVKYVEEHCLFRPTIGKRLGKYKDQVDSSSAVYALLAGIKPGASMVVRPFGSGQKRGLFRLVVCTKQELESVVVTDHVCSLILFFDPVADKSEQPPVPPVGIAKLADSAVLTFADVDPSEHQATWSDPIEPWGVKAEELIATRDHGRKLWTIVAKRRESPVEVVVLADDGDGRAMSTAMGICDVMRLPRKSTICRLGSEGEEVGDKEPAPNQFLYDLVKSCRGMVI